MVQHFHNQKLHNQETFCEIQKKYSLTRLKVAGTECRAILHYTLYRYIQLYAWLQYNRSTDLLFQAYL